ncbi:restriction endonuclease subunit S [Streptococcus sp. H49]|uniref:restriction endonuclease subunit S n=1 Tax=Streptococcus huangxiaojuni TaxID=3237239 RepID=UPI0034A3964D
MSKLKLTDVEWGEFKVGDIFEIFTGSLISNPKLGLIPRITATDVNNGVAMFTSLYEEKARYFSNFISISFLGSVFYHKNTVSLDMKIHGIKPRGYELTSESSLFLIPLIKNFSFKYSYGYQLSTRILMNQKLMLPIDSQGQPNWQFMEDYIKQEQQQQAQQVIDYYERKLVELASDVVGLEKVEWKTFQFTEVFQEIQRGKRLTRANQTDGLKPYISSTAENNGVDGFIGNNAGVREFENVLTLANSGSIGSTFYQQFEFVASDHVTALKSENADKYAYLFLSSVVKRLEEKYSFNREINDTRIKREKIILPADKNGNPDFQYMSDFVKKLELDKVQEVLEYIYIYIYQTEDNA